MQAVTLVPSGLMALCSAFFSHHHRLRPRRSRKGFRLAPCSRNHTASGRARTCPTGLHENVPDLNLLREVDGRGRREVWAPKGLPKIWSAPEFPRLAQGPANILRL